MRTVPVARIFSLCALLLLNACAHNQSALHPTDSRAPGPSPADSLCVMLAKDGTYGATTYNGSGRAVANRISAAARSRYPQVLLLELTNEDEAIQRCARTGAKYLLSPTILHWEDRATNWSGLPDRIKVEIRLVKLSPKELLRSAEFEAKSTWFTFVNKDPSDLLDESFDQVVVHLTGS